MPEEIQIEAVPSALVDGLKNRIFAFQDYALLAVQSVMNIFTPPRYWADTVEQMDIIGVGALVIVAIASFFIGGVLVINTAAQLEKFGMAQLTGEGVSLALVRELGPTITALLIAGRNASGIASELGSMVVTEQVDAMRALGTDPIRKLMTPRVLAMVLMLPLLVATFDFVGLIGGSVTAYFTLRIGTEQFWHVAVDSLVFGDIVQGLAKPFIFALIISTVGCYQGLRVKGGTQGVGRATIAAFVISSVTMIISDLFLSKLFLWIFRH
jgi:phospholipid/cholesterol/gamma-HCH transport system permease protein